MFGSWTFMKNVCPIQRLIMPNTHSHGVHISLHARHPFYSLSKWVCLNGMLEKRRQFGKFQTIVCFKLCFWYHKDSKNKYKKFRPKRPSTWLWVYALHCQWILPWPFVAASTLPFCNCVDMMWWLDAGECWDLASMAKSNLDPFPTDELLKILRRQVLRRNFEVKIFHFLKVQVHQLCHKKFNFLKLFNFKVLLKHHWWIVCLFVAVHIWCQSKNIFSFNESFLRHLLWTALKKI